MRSITRLILLTAALAAPALGADDAKKPDPAAMQAAMEQMAKTGPEHEALAKTVGSWTIEETMWMDPSAPPMTAKHKSTRTSTLEGKWIREELVGEFMGKPYSAIGFNGYDTTAKQYVSSWMHTASTDLTVMKGQSADGGKTIVLHGTMEHCPGVDGPMAMRMVVANESADKMTCTMFGTPQGGAETKMFEMVYTRAK
ncbi:MAG TPA: DUF1579 domain-containing protein [Planctomycetota bacterium]|nr:DUF1579 domain-containing protein [Planctomycetota bacterium]